MLWNKPEKQGASFAIEQNWRFSLKEIIESMLTPKNTYLFFVVKQKV